MVDSMSAAGALVRYHRRIVQTAPRAQTHTQPPPRLLEHINVAGSSSDRPWSMTGLGRCYMQGLRGSRRLQGSPADVCAYRARGTPAAGRVQGDKSAARGAFEPCMVQAGAPATLNTSAQVPTVRTRYAHQADQCSLRYY